MKTLKIHLLQHVAFEGLGCIADWISEKGHELTTTKLYETVQFPNVSDIDWVIIMGGPMSIHDENEYPWLRLEKIFIKQAIDQNKIVLGVCLGAQLIANVLGGKIYPNNHKEIGWFPITQTEENHFLLKSFETTFPVFHWHGETFDIPKKAVRLFESEACKNQGFIYNDKVVGFQFHLEVTSELVVEMAENCKSDIQEAPYVQPFDLITQNNACFSENNELMFRLLDVLASWVP